MGGVPSVYDITYYWQVYLSRNNTSLVLRNERICDKEAVYIASALKKNDRLLYLDLGENEIGDEGAKCLIEGLRVNQSLLSLRLDNNRISHGVQQDINDLLVRNNRLKFISILRDRESIDFTGCKFGTVKVFAVAEALRVNKTITKIGLRDNDAGPEGASALAKTLRYIPSLTTIDLSMNSVGLKGSDAIADSLTFHSNQLTTLLLGENGIGNDGCESLGTMLQRNTILRVLDLKYNKITSAGCQSLITSLYSVNHTLTTLILSRNNLRHQGARLLSDMLQTNQTLTTLDISGNCIGHVGCASLMDGLTANETLLCLRIDANNIGTKGAISIAAMFQINYTLQVLSIDGNGIGEDGLAAIVEGLQSCGIISLKGLIGVDLNTPTILASLRVNVNTADNKPPRSSTERARRDNRVILAELHCRKENEACLPDDKKHLL